MDGASPHRRPHVLSGPTLARLVSLEGGEGAGKTTQQRLLAAHLEAAGERVVQTREPGGSAGGEAIRTLLIEGAHDRWSPTSELFLFLAARHDHLERVIRPALHAGAWVVTDRFWDSTRVYQGLVGSLDLDAIDRLHDAWLTPFRPGLTFLLDLPADAGLARARGGRFEAKGLAFHERVRAGFGYLAAREPERFVVVDAGLDLQAVRAALIGGLEAHRARLQP